MIMVVFLNDMCQSVYQCYNLQQKHLGVDSPPELYPHCQYSCPKTPNDVKTSRHDIKTRDVI